MGSTSPGSARSSIWNRTPFSSATTTPHYEPTTPGSEPDVSNNLPTRNGRRRTRNLPGAGHRRGARPPTRTVISRPDPVSPTRQYQLTAHHERHHDHAHIELDY